MSSIFEILRGPDAPVIGEDHPDAGDVNGGFEGGRLLKLDGVYHIFPTERAYDRIRTRIGHWVSDDAVHWSRQSTIYQSSGNYTDISTDHPASDRRAALWSFLPIYNEDDGRWNGFYVAYTRHPEIAPVPSCGLIWRTVSTTPGTAGIAGPWFRMGDAHQFRDISFQRYSGDSVLRRNVERWIENLVNASIDIAKVIVSSERQPIPQTDRETILRLQSVPEFGGAGIESLSRYVRLRNILAYEYIDIRFERIARLVREAPDAYRRMIDGAREFAA